jgi:sigma-B regulation protein RsbU (phosphoserine phosphatase)
MFITVLYGILDVTKNKINIASAGHNNTLVYRGKTMEIEQYNPKGFPLGIVPGERFDKVIKDEDILLNHGDKLIIFTDGITEAMNSAKEEFGDERLLETITKTGSKNGKEILDAIINNVAGFVKEAEQSDDIALVVLTRV